MPADPPGPSPTDASDPAPATGGSTSSSKAEAKAGPGAAGPKRTPRPAPKAGGGGARRSASPPAPAPEADGASVRPAATAVAERPAVVTPPAGPADDTGTLAGVPATVPAPAKPRAPRPAPARGGRRGRRVKRVVRRIDLWSVLKLSLVVYTCLYLAVMATLAALWSLLYTTNTIDKVTSFLADVGLENFHFYGDQMFRACAAIGAVGVMAGTVMTVLATALVNVISEITGGIRLIVIEEDPAN